MLALVCVKTILLLQVLFDEAIKSKGFLSL